MMPATPQTNRRAISQKEPIGPTPGSMMKPATARPHIGPGLKSLHDQTSEADTSEQARLHSVVYLACPYTHCNREVRVQRFQAATKAAASLVRQGYIVYSPITMTHPIDVVLAGNQSTLGSAYWIEFDKAIMDFCAEMVVLTIPGWDHSEGIQREIEHFKSQGKPIKFMTFPNDDSNLLSISEITKIDGGTQQ
jgi:uncharacterized protein DUF1937